MPYARVWRNPRLVLTRKGVKVYAAYKDDDVEQGERTYYFVTDPESGEDEAFDVRELANWKEPPHPPYISGEGDTPENRKAWEKYHKDHVEEAILAVLRTAIEGDTPENRKAWEKYKDHVEEAILAVLRTAIDRGLIKASK